MTIDWGTVSWADWIAILIASIAIAVSLLQYRAHRHSLSLDVFTQALGLLADKETRKERKDVYEAFDPAYELPNEKEGNVTLWIRKSTGLEDKERRIKVDLPEDRKHLFEDVCVKFDRVGLMLFELQLPDKFRDAYLKWMCMPICGMWNRLSPYIYLERNEKDRKNCVPYFENLAYSAFKYYTKVKEDPKLVCLNKNCTIDGKMVLHSKDS